MTLLSRVGDAVLLFLFACAVLLTLYELAGHAPPTATPVRPGVVDVGDAHNKQAQLAVLQQIERRPTTTTSISTTTTTTTTPLISPFVAPKRVGLSVEQRLAAALARENASSSAYQSSLVQSRTPTQLLVLGMHHSGTSLLCRALTLMGLYGGERHDFHLMSGDNPPKWWERKDVINLNLMLVEPSAAPRDKWYSGFGYEASKVSNETNRLFDYRARKVVEKLNARRPWVTKEPRLSITMRHWRPLLDAPLCVFLYRHPMAVTAGLLRHWPAVNRLFSEREWLLLWEKYTLGALRGCAGLPLVLVSHEHLAQAPMEALRLLHSDLVRLGVPDVKLPDAQAIELVFGKPFFQPVISSVNISVSQYRLFRALDTNSVQKEFYNAQPDAWSWWGDVTPELDATDANWKLAGVDRLDYTPAWQQRVAKLGGARGKDKLSSARQLLGYREPDAPRESDGAAAAADDELSQVRARVRQSMRANVGAAPQQRVSTWRADLVPLVRELEARDAPDAEVDAAIAARPLAERPPLPPTLPASASLAAVLARVANAERDVVAVYANLAFAELTRNLVCHLRRLGMRNFVVLALDGELCGALGDASVPCVFDGRFGAGFNEHQRWTNALKSHYFRMLQLKLSYTAQVLALGYNLLLSDADTAYVSDALAYVRGVLRAAPDTDLLIQSDARPQVAASVDWVCAGNFYMRSTPAAQAFVREAALLMHATGFPDQDCFQLILTGREQEMRFPADTRYRSAHELGLRFALLDPLRVANGGVYFAARLNDKLNVTPVLVHANQNWDKETRLRKAGLWCLAGDE